MVVLEKEGEPMSQLWPRRLPESSKPLPSLCSFLCWSSSFPPLLSWCSAQAGGSHIQLKVYIEQFLLYLRYRVKGII